jgi:hypothetical protein
MAPTTLTVKAQGPQSAGRSAIEQPKLALYVGRARFVVMSFYGTLTAVLTVILMALNVSLHQAGI